MSNSMNIVAHNLQGMFSERQLGITSNNKSKSTEKLSSGYRINRSADDAAGLAISEKMRRQIRGLTQGTNNAQDGISLCQIADGALEEVDDMLHRLTELSIQAANGTYSSEDRQALQSEVNHLIAEIDRISETTVFNETNILGLKITRSGQTMPHQTALDELSSGVFKTIATDLKDTDGNIVLSKDAANSMFAIMSCYFSTSTLYDEYKDGLLQYDGRNGTQTKKTSDLMKMVAEAARPLAAWKGINIDDKIDTKIDLAEKFLNAPKAYDPGPETSPTYNPDNADLHATNYAHIGITHHCEPVDITSLGSRTVNVYTGEIVQTAGYAFTQAMDDVGFLGADASVYYSQPGTHSYQRNREEIFFTGALDYFIQDLQKIPEYDQTEVNDVLSYYVNSISDKDSIADLYAFLSSDEKITIEDSRDIWIQSGTESDDGIMLHFDSLNSTILGIKNVNVSTQGGAKNSISKISNALEKVSSIRSGIGAQQNRLEHTINNQKNIIENTQSAESQIRDTDMAKEMVQYTKENILEQAGISILSQANQSNQGIISLLQ